MMCSLLIKRTAAAAALLALPVSLAACSSHTSHTAVSSATTHASTSSGAPTAKSGGGSSKSGKPTKAQVAAGMSDYFVGKGVPRSLVNDVSTCVADKGYTQFSDRTLRALQHGTVSRLNPLDAGKLTKVTTDCLAGGKSGSLPSSAG